MNTARGRARRRTRLKPTSSIRCRSDCSMSARTVAWRISDFQAFCVLATCMRLCVGAAFCPRRCQGVRKVRLVRFVWKTWDQMRTLPYSSIELKVMSCKPARTSFCLSIPLLPRTGLLLLHVRTQCTGAVMLQLCGRSRIKPGVA